MRTCLCFLILLFFAGNQALAQSGTIDELKQELEVTVNDSSRVVLLTDISWEYATFNSDLALEYAQQALDLALRIDNEKCKSLSYAQIGVVYYFRSEYPKSIENFTYALEINEKIGDTASVISNRNNIAGIYSGMEQYDKAEHQYLELLKICETYTDQSEYGFVMGNLAAVYALMMNYDQALSMGFEALKYQEDPGSQYQQWANFAEWYYHLDELDSAMFAINKSLDILQEYDPNNLYYLSQCYSVKGNVHRGMGEKELALENYGIAIAYADSSGSLARKEVTLMLMSDIHQEYGDWELSLLYFKEGQEIRDSIQALENMRAVEDIQTKYETEKKQAENDLLKQEKLADEAIKSRQSLVIWSGAGGLLLVLVVAFQLLRANRARQRANELLEVKNATITEQKKDLTDSIEYAQRIQFTILPSVEKINDSLKNAFVYYEPRDIVSGDFFFHHEKDDKVFLASCDCTGHGVPGAFISITCANLLKHWVIDMDLNDPGKILSAVNQGVHKAFKADGAQHQASDGMDATLCVIYKNENRVEVAGAMNAPVQVRGEELIETRVDRTPIGGRTAQDYEFKTISLAVESGDKVYLYSDGYPDQFGGPKGKKYMAKRFKQFLVKISSIEHTRRPEVLQKELVQWQGDLERVDDVLVMGFEV